MTKFAALGIYKYFPSNFEAYKNTSANDRVTLLKHTGYLHIMDAALLTILFLVDLFYFYFHPFQLHIVVDLEEKTETDRAVLRKLAIESEMDAKNNSRAVLLKNSFLNTNRVSLNIYDVA